MPPLRDRKEDIPLLVKHFVEKYNKKESKQIKGISPEVERNFTIITGLAMSVNWKIP